MKLLETLGKPTIYKNYRCVSFKGAVGITSAYAINRLGAKKLLDYAYPIRFTADGLTGRFMDTGVRLYGILPHCCYQSNDFRSIIDPSRHAPGSFS
jgi:GR25 family glycosyltransferase involved in LPS biosynthesis